jgi:hypothetical protein
VYLSTSMDVAGYRWKFYMQKHQRNDIFERTQYFPSNVDISRVPSGSLLVFQSRDPAVERLLTTGRCAIAATIRNAAGSDATVVLKVAG